MTLALLTEKHKCVSALEASFELVTLVLSADMGVQGLWELLAPCGRRVEMQSMSTKVLAVDASIWLIQFIKAMRDPETGKMTPNAHLLGLFRRLCKLLFLQIKPVLVFDGATPEIKLRTIRQRRIQHDRQEARLRRSAEKLLMNQLKQQALQVAKGSLSKSKKNTTDAGKSAQFVASSSHRRTETRKETDVAHSNEEESEKSQGQETEAVYVDERGRTDATVDDDLGEDSEWEDMEGAEVQFDNPADIDPEVFHALPTDLKRGVIDRLRGMREIETRDSIVAVAGNMEKFAGVQLQNFVKKTAIKKRIRTVETKLAAGPAAIVDGVECHFKNIASDASKKYILAPRTVLEGADKKVVQPEALQPAALDIAADEDDDLQRAISQSLADAATGENRSQKKGKGKDPQPGERIHSMQQPANGPSEENADLQIGINQSLQQSVIESSRLAMSDPTGIGHMDETDLLRFVAAQESNNGGGGFAIQDQGGSCLDGGGFMDDGSHGEALAGGFVRDDDNGDHDIAGGGGGFIPDEGTPPPELESPSSGPPSEDEAKFDKVVSRSAALLPPLVENADDVCKALEKLDEGDASHVGGDDDDGWEEVVVKQEPKHNPGSDNDDDCWEEVVDQNSKGSDPVRKKDVTDLSEEAQYHLALVQSMREQKKAITGPKIIKVEDADDIADISATIAKEVASKRGVGSASVPINVDSSSSDSSDSLKDELDGEEQFNVTIADNDGEEQISNCDDSNDWDVVDVNPPHPKDRNANEEQGFRSPERSKAIGWNDNRKVDAVNMKAFLEGDDAAIAPPAVALLERQSKLAENPDDYHGESNQELFERELGRAMAEEDRKRREEQSFAEDSERCVHFDEETVTVRRPLEQEELGYSNDMNPEDIGAVDRQEQHDPITRNGPSPPPEFANEILTSADLDMMQEDLDRERAALQNAKSKGERDVERVTPEMLAECKELLRLFGIPFITSPMEAEAQCAMLEGLGLVDGTVSEDVDTFLFGGKLVLKNIFDHKKYVEAYRAADIQRDLGLTRESLVLLAYLLGSDYTEGVRGVGIVNAMEIVAAFREKKAGETDDIEILKGFNEWVHDVTHPTGVRPDDSKFLRDFKAQHKNVRRSWETLPGFPDQQVMDAYINPMVDKSREPFSWQRPDIPALLQFCRTYFFWSEEKSRRILDPVMKAFDEREKQTRIDQFFLTTRFAKIRSKRIARAVQSSAGAIDKDMVVSDDDEDTRAYQQRDDDNDDGPDESVVPAAKRIRR